MQSGFQTSGVTYWQHGKMVANRFEDLMSEQPKMEWNLPSWFSENEDQIRDLLLPNMNQIIEYQIWHDCGKPFCRVAGDDGKSHYPDHASVSAEIWRKLGGNETTADLIERDMDWHTTKPSETSEIENHPLALPLLVTALCEVHANAQMFGGFDSDSFKIKHKRLTRSGNSTIKRILTNAFNK